MTTTRTVDQPRWQRVVLLFVLGYEAAGCIVGGSFLIAAPDGHLMDMPVELMHGTFRDFLIPGIILFGLGILNTFAFFAVLRRSSMDWFWAVAAMSGLAIWFWVEIAIILELHWLHAMWGLPVIAGGLSATGLLPHREEFLRKAFLICGVISSILYAAITVIVAMQWPSYNSASHTVSELSAVDAPTRTLWLVLSTPYTITMIAFAVGIWRSAGNNRRLRIAGGLLIAYGALGLIWPFAPMHLRETLAAGGGTFSDTMHLTLGGITEVIYLLALGFAAAALGKLFRAYSIATFMVLLVFGILTALDAPKVATNEPTASIGIWERINIGVFLLWVVVLAIRVFPTPVRSASTITSRVIG